MTNVVAHALSTWLCPDDHQTYRVSQKKNAPLSLCNSGLELQNQPLGQAQGLVQKSTYFSFEPKKPRILYMHL